MDSLVVISDYIIMGLVVFTELYIYIYVGCTVLKLVIKFSRVDADGFLRTYGTGVYCVPPSMKVG